MLKNKKICIIGGAGFVGLHLIELLSKNNKIIVVDIGTYESKPYLKNFIAKNHYLDYSKTDYLFLRNECYNYIFYLAGNTSIKKSVEKPLYDLKFNLLPYLKILDIIKNSKTIFVLASSAACYGEMKNNKYYYPISPYGIIKLAEENYLKFYNKYYNLPALIFRFFSLFGEYNKKQVIYDTVIKLLNNKKTLTVYNPDYMRDFIYIKDALKIVLSICNMGKYDADVYDVGLGCSTSILEMSNKIAKYLNLKPDIIIKHQNNVYEPKLQVANIKPIIEKGIKVNLNLDKNLLKTIKWIKNNI